LGCRAPGCFECATWSCNGKVLALRSLPFFPGCRKGLCLRYVYDVLYIVIERTALGAHRISLSLDSAEKKFFFFFREKNFSRKKKEKCIEHCK